MKLDWITFWVGAIATYRITVAISRDFVFKWLRKLPYIGFWAKCPYCVSPYTAGIVCVALCLSGVDEPFLMWIMIAFAWSGITIALDRTFSADVTN